jgi:dipeptide/tripeptide permease
MSTGKNESTLSLIKSFDPMFWVASIMELFERWAWYGLFAVLALYLTGSTDDGGLGFTHTEKGQIMGIVTAILYLLPLFTGIISDKIGYKLSLVISYIMLMTGYYFMGEVTSYTAVFLIFLWVAVGAAMFKPVASAIVTKSTTKKNSTLGFGIFYMMVNIGGFIGPAFSSGLREKGWGLVFIQAAIVIGINLIIVLIFYKEQERVKSNKGVLETIKESLNNIVEALKDTKLSVLLLIMIGFWTMFNQLFYTLPTFIEDWVDTSSVSKAITDFSPAIGNYISSDGQIKPEWFTNIDAGMIILLQILVSSFVIKMRHVTAMIRGFIIAIIGISLTFYFKDVTFTILGVVIFAIGEMTTNPTFSSFIAIISPKGKEALYQGTYFVPIFVGNLLTTFVSGNLYQAWSDKLTLVKNYLGTKDIALTEVGTRYTENQFLEKSANAFSISVEKVRMLLSNDVFANKDWSLGIKELKKYAEENGIEDYGALSAEFSKNDYILAAAESLDMSKWEMTSVIWDNYSPNKIWWVISGIGVVTVSALIVYDNLVVKPREKNGAATETE